MNTKNWYMISTIRGKEEHVLEALSNRIVAEEVSHNFDLEATPEGPFKMFKRPVLTAREAEKKRAELPYKIKWINMYPGYIFAKLEMSDEAWFVIRNTQYVTGLIGSSGKGAKPTPVTNREIRKCLEKEREALENFNSGKNVFEFKIDDIVEVIDGPYQGEVGPIVKIDQAKNVAVISIETFGKKNNVEIDLDFLNLSSI
ncbi:transcription termination/antitermination protein NusG [Mycoplasmopsis gallinacea]|uniref:Transcription termination/antitermination protein NusG n=1 Tax=Mycoplasmopsis gallinacea TaxID=29556 RepID=A0A0D5ZJL0_9BACT|nr:transcription termination/antitermination protein NusG [Mycoplasmopsis gallinacea]AKA49879.1 antitermination protein NusG [Mycoplasmopsis gallinacea]QIW62240.1 transcription termination/antitermination protein NusG [Mycoplasmopsis gallinacea]VEU58895.1 Transcription antitermination protein nusG [Mycoplasmopsis gallinacea]